MAAAGMVKGVTSRIYHDGSGQKRLDTEDRSKITHFLEIVDHGYDDLPIEIQSAYRSLCERFNHE